MKVPALWHFGSSVFSSSVFSSSVLRSWLFGNFGTLIFQLQGSKVLRFMPKVTTASDICCKLPYDNTAVKENNALSCEPFDEVSLSTIIETCDYDYLVSFWYLDKRAE
ncbi:hypothetical protein RhiirA1_436416 [Rhizophagus irregularis]|uniref:Uncharacterized protein n=2 Tax=Rhizophagus irregularis TaxID=588596 RepID=A0A2N0SI50_9GLOM|nr:hypothetical protein RhiirA1_436416 [Rhizophagus irregularis]